MATERTTYQTHDFFEYCHISLGMHKQTILDFLRNNSGARVLDIGCGSGNALREMIDICNANGFSATFTGLDLTEDKPAEFPKGVNYISADISTLDVREFKNQFDLIISVNVFHYVINREYALSNVAKMLSGKGRAFISLEPFYFGPYGTQLFMGSNCCQWDEEYRNILVKPSFSPVIRDKNAFYPYALPPQCHSKVYLKEGMEREQTITVQMPICYKSEVEASFLEHFGIKKSELVDQKKMAANWDILEFLSVKTPNQNGHHLSGTEGFRPFLFGVITPYFRQQGLSAEAVAVLIMMPELYDQHSRKSNWREGESFKLASTFCLESLGLIGHNCLTEDEQQKIQKAVQAEVDLARLNNATHIFSPKSIIQLTVAIAILAVIIKILLTLQPSTPGLGR